MQPAQGGIFKTDGVKFVPLTKCCVVRTREGRLWKDVTFEKTGRKPENNAGKDAKQNKRRRKPR